MFHLEPEFFIPFLVFAIPIIAIIGGITAGIVRTLGQQRLAELAARERLAAIEKGIDPSKLTPPPGLGTDWGGDWSGAPRDPHRRAQSLMIGGLVTLAVGIGLSILIWTTSGGEGWAVGLIPGLVGLALLLSAWIVKPKNGSAAGHGPGSMPQPR